MTAIKSILASVVLLSASMSFVSPVQALDLVARKPKPKPVIVVDPVVGPPVTTPLPVPGCRKCPKFETPQTQLIEPSDRPVQSSTAEPKVSAPKPKRQTPRRNG